LQWAFGAHVSPCPCPRPDCEGKQGRRGPDLFGPTDPFQVAMDGPFFDHSEAIITAQVKAGQLDESVIEARKPTVEELLNELDGVPPKRDTDLDPPDPSDGSTWNLG
jgi:hypothetical protein